MSPVCRARSRRFGCFSICIPTRKAAIVGAFFYFDLGAYLTLDGFKSRQAMLSTYVADHPWQSGLIFFFVYARSYARVEESKL